MWPPSVILTDERSLQSDGQVSGGGAGAGLFPLNQRCSTFMISCSSAGTWANTYCR